MEVRKFAQGCSLSRRYAYLDDEEGVDIGEACCWKDVAEAFVENRAFEIALPPPVVEIRSRYKAQPTQSHALLSHSTLLLNLRLRNSSLVQRCCADPKLPCPRSFVVRRSLSLQSGSLPSARKSVARLLAHYVVAAAACSIRRQKGAGGAAAVVKSARAAAIGRGGGAGPETGTDDESSDSSSSDDYEDDDASDGSNTAVLSRHLSALCAANLAGNEVATLEFLRCVGDYLFVTPEAGTAVSSSSSHPSGDRVAILVCVAPACARALARLPRPSASPAPSAAQFLRRAYAFRVMDALNQSAASASLKSSSSGSARKGVMTTASVAIASRRRGANGSAGSSAASQGVSRTPTRWDFVGAARAPPSLLHFLSRPEGPVAVGKGPAAAALKELASRRHSPAEVAELLRSSPACAPAALGPLLSAMEGLEGSARGEEDQQGVGGERREGNGTAPDVVGGFFVDTGGAGAETVLASLGGGGGGVADMDEEAEAASVVSSALSDHEGDG